MDKVKNALNKALSFVKKYWYFFLASLVLLLSVIFLKNGQFEDLYKSLMKKYRQALNNGQEDLQEVSDIRINEQQKQRELDAKYRQTIKELEQKRLVESQNISVQQENVIKHILADTNRSPEEMAQLVHETLGLPIR